MAGGPLPSAFIWKTAVKTMRGLIAQHRPCRILLGFAGTPDRTVHPHTRRRFLDNIIPQERWAPIARTYLEKFVPLPNSGEREFTRLLLTQFQTNQITTRLDANLTDADTLSATFFTTS